MGISTSILVDLGRFWCLSGVVNEELQFGFEEKGQKMKKNKVMTYFNEVNSLDG
jgi:hypothetical protein